MNIWLDGVVNCYNLHFKGVTDRPVIYDVGSRDGDDAKELADRIGARGEDVVLIEANPQQQSVITYRHADSNFTLVSCAVLDVEGEHDFVQVLSYDPDEVGTSSLDFNKPDKDFKNYNIIKVKTRRLDDIITSLGHDIIDVMKIDIEGFSWEALQSMGDLLKRVRVLHIETEAPGVARNKTSQDIYDFMKANEFTIFSKEYQWGEGIEDQVWYNWGIKG